MVVCVFSTPVPLIGRWTCDADDADDDEEVDDDVLGDVDDDDEDDDDDDDSSLDSEAANDASKLLTPTDTASLRLRMTLPLGVLIDCALAESSW